MHIRNHASYDDIRIVRLRIARGTTQASVYQGTTLIHRGSRPVDNNFADRVQSTLTRRGYEGVAAGGETRFHRHAY